ncbi:MAG: YIP1 family protein [Clostridia bacterium]|nr:YIP1 family protein [Clostridia bacterium]
MKSIKMCAQAIFHPLDCFDLVKQDRDRTPWLTMVVIWVLAALCQVASVYLTAFALNPNLPDESNLLLLLALIFVPLFSWVVGSYSTTTLMGGEAKFTESLTGATYGLVPYIVTTPFLIGLSYLLSGEAAGLFNTLQALVLVWVIILQFLSFMRLNDYEFVKAIGVAFVGLVAVLLIWAVVMLLFVFTYQAFLFFKEVYLELKNQQLFM